MALLAGLADDVRAGLSSQPEAAAAEVLLRRAWIRALRADHDAARVLPDAAPSRRSSTRLRHEIVAPVRARGARRARARAPRARRTRCSTRWSTAGSSTPYVPVDVSESAVREAAAAPRRRRTRTSSPRRRRRLRAAISSACAHNGSRRLIAFLGGTIGNLDRGERSAVSAPDARACSARTTAC